ncbi:bacterio-opsin activator-like protein [Halococcus morrhuae DSM 1307]|uniref:Bacterio-opsin activator-like protein n=1 Tax=Halococcus morrhuae DSM 1307 TaxID=931277 RepID=M0MPG9_HALMO|nr:helix-turn-helix domain-containing protein [Halococcus morrhuae]EMA46624.1 bacterio-opsin activator-like protein [Halococcus morrhuae DSM 1307]
MNSATIHIDLNDDYVLSDLSTIRDESFPVYYFEVIEGDNIRFVINAGQYKDEIMDILQKANAVQSVKPLPDSQLLITKRSSGVLPIIRDNHATLRKMTKFEGTHRTFNIVVSDRETIKEIIGELEDLGTVQLEQLRPVGKPTSILSARQSEVLELAYNEGYFDWPRRTDAETLANQLGITHATFLEHVRKSESKILGEILNNELPNQNSITSHR